MEAECAHLVIADPPYNIGVKNAEWDTIDDYLEFTESWLREAVRLLHPQGTLMVWGSPNRSWIFRVAQMAEDRFDLKLVQSLCWTYTTGGDGRFSTMKTYATRHEVLMWFSLSHAYTFNAKAVADAYTEEEKTVAIAKGSGRLKEDSLAAGRPPRSWFQENRENSRSRERRHGSHPSMKPLSVCDRIVNAHSNKGDLVVVPFAGSGSEMISSWKSGRRCAGFEKEVAYFEIAARRMRSHGIVLHSVSPNQMTSANKLLF
jgi:DNA modification methylase